MLALLLAIQVATTDSVYSSAPLQTLVAEAAAANRVVSQSLASYRARTESDVAILMRDGRGDEQVVQLEQVASEMRWRNGTALEQRIIGYRTTAQPTASSSLTVSALTILRRPWIVPTLSGNRFRLLLIWRDGSVRPNGNTTLEVIHPLANDRETFYRFDGADTVTAMLADGRSIPTIRIRVRPGAASTTRSLLFSGEVYLDVVAHQVVRMRGEFVAVGSNPSAWARLVRRGLQTVTCADLINEEIADRVWVPAYQRLEVRGVSPLAKDFRPVVRIVSRIRGHVVEDATVSRPALAAAPSTARTEHPVETLTLAARESLSRFAGWTDEMGVANSEAGTSTFDDLTADARPQGGQAADTTADRLDITLRSHRLVRLYTSMAERFQSYRIAPAGLSVKADAGQIWSDPSTRGAVTLQWRRASWLSSIRAQRTLLRTNGLLPALGSEPWALTFNLAHDDARQLDRRYTRLALTRRLGGTNGAVLHIGAGLAGDRPESIGIRLSPAVPDSGRSASALMMPNVQSGVTLEFHPTVAAERPTSGIGAGLTYERRDGDIRWERTVGWLLARHTGTTMTYTARIDGAAVMRWRSPPQALLEIAPSDNVSDNAFLQASGRRAALLRLSAAYRLPFPTTSLQSLRWVYLPSASPSIGVGLQSEWNDAFISRPVVPPRLPGPLSIDATAGREAPLPRHRDAIRSTATVVIRPFGGAVGFGIGRSIDRGSNWTLSFVTDPWW